jgi:hypothetical protein
LLSFWPEYGSSTLLDTDTSIQFNFNYQMVYPAKLNAFNLGQIAIFRGSISADGAFVKTSNVLWAQTDLDEAHLPDPFQQGNLICT